MIALRNEPGGKGVNRFLTVCHVVGGSKSGLESKSLLRYIMWKAPRDIRILLINNVAFPDFELTILSGLASIIG